MLNFRFKFNDLARRNAVPRMKPNSDFTEPIAEVYPNNPVIQWKMCTGQIKRKTPMKTVDEKKSIMNVQL